MKPKRSFYSLPYGRAMVVAKQVASLEGAMDWSLYRDWMDRYERVRLNRVAKLPAPEPQTPARRPRISDRQLALTL